MRDIIICLTIGLLACSDPAPEAPPAEETPADCPTGKCDGVGDPDGNLFEYIVVGSGAGGGPLAANLARQGHSVLLLEAGEDMASKLEYQVPSFHALASETPGLAWSYYVDHYSDPAQAARDSKATDKGVLYPRGGTLGGSTAVNAMITVLPHDSDWDAIADLTGDDSWRADKMRRYFQNVEANGYLGGGERGHGYDGWLSVERFPLTNAIGDTLLLKIATGAALGFVNEDGGWGIFQPFRDVGELLALLKRDVNEQSADRDNREGLFSIPVATRDGRRNGTRDYIVRTVNEGYPLTVRTRSLVTRVLWAEGDGTPKAEGVEYLAGAHLYRADPQADDTKQGERTEVFATREVILSAGAFNTPQLLKLSGVGPKAELEQHGIETVVDLPGVGENLQDRYEVGIVFELEDDFALLDGCTFGRGFDPCLREWEDNEGAYPSNGAAFGMIKRSNSAGIDPDLFVFGAPGVFKGYYPGYAQDAIADKHHFTWVILKGHTENRAGRVTLRSTDPRDYPKINFHYFEDGDTEEFEDWYDVQAVVDGIELAREIGETTDSLMIFDEFDEIWPGTKLDTREKLAQFVKDEAWGHHASCSARMGPDGDPMAVLDSRFRVRGTEGLRVVDASVFPRIPGFFIVVPIYMVSEKATDVILADIGETRRF